MRVGIVDVGANTLRLLAADVGRDGVAPVRTDRVELGLGEDIEDRGTISKERLVHARRVARKHAATARRLGCSRIVVVVTSPGRQAENAGDLLDALAGIRGATVRVLSAEEEATFAYRGALAGLDDLPESVAVCDVGGGSTQLVVGSCERGPAWARSIDLGSLRLTRRALPHDPPTSSEVDRARVLVEPLFAALAPPLPHVAFATGGSARALAEIVGRQLGAEELAVALTSRPNGRRGASRRRSSSRNGAPALWRRERCCSARRRASSACRSRSRAAGFARVSRSPCSKRSSSPRRTVRQSRS